jgi:parvulin-like peptidyl-prolyl cis-trans isomerase-like protein
MIEVPHRAGTRSWRALAALALVTAVASGCASTGGSKTQAGAGGTSAAQGGAVSTTTPTKEPDHIVVQHILIGAKGSVRGKNITRTMEEARILAYALAESARKGEDFDALVRANTDDAFPGRYGMANRGVTPAGANEYGRDNMVPAFGNVGFKLAVGEIGVADYDPQTSPYGYHVIKRVQ